MLNPIRHILIFCTLIVFATPSWCFNPEQTITILHTSYTMGYVEPSG